MTANEKSTALEAPKSALEQLEELGGSLNDFDGSEGGTPRISINGAEARWVDSLSGLEVPEFTGIICGIQKQRVLWPAEVGEEKSDPLCKSLDAKTGRPNPKTFPLKESNLGLELVEDVVVTADCGACSLKDWDSHPTRNGPWCTEQITAILMADMEGNGTFLPALVSFQRSSLKPARTYLGSFARAQEHPFNVYTKFSLQGLKRGNVKYAVPIFTKLGATPPDLRESAAANYLALREYIVTWRDEKQDDGPIKVQLEEELPEF